MDLAFCPEFECNLSLIFIVTLQGRCYLRFILVCASCDSQGSLLALCSGMWCWQGWNRGWLYADTLPTVLSLWLYLGLGEGSEREKNICCFSWSDVVKLSRLQPSRHMWSPFAAVPALTLWAFYLPTLSCKKQTDMEIFVCFRVIWMPVNVPKFVKTLVSSFNAFQCGKFLGTENVGVFWPTIALISLHYCWKSARKHKSKPRLETPDQHEGGCSLSTHLLTI